MSSSPSSSSKKDSKSITPQRKHRKLLKDGSGTEVWPESIESIFVQGLHDYWESPWATYSQSRGRSRWRNQFLVDYLQKAGIIRTKKQVASHIQVLRNMWKGEPEFYLVSGGDEPSSETGANPVKLEDRYDTSALIPLDFEENDGSSSTYTSPNSSPLDSQTDFPPSPGLFNNNQMPIYPVPDGKDFQDASSYSRGLVFTTSIPSSLSIYPVDTAAQHSQDHLPLHNNHYPLDAYSSSIPTAYGRSSPPGAGFHEGIYQNSSLHALRHDSPQHYAHPRHPSNRATAMCLLADGMTPFSVKVDALMPSSNQSTPALKIKLNITSVDDIRSPSTLHGFAGSVSLARVWTNSGKCITRAYANNVCISEEVGALDISTVEFGTANAVLPDSSLSRCRWFDTSIPTSLTQEIVVDDETLIYLIYELDRTTGAMPSAQLLGYQNRKNPAKPPSQPHPAQAYPAAHPTSYPAYPSASLPRRTTQTTSLASALIPPNNLRHPSVNSMAF